MEQALSERRLELLTPQQLNSKILDELCVSTVEKLQGQLSEANFEARAQVFQQRDLLRAESEKSGKLELELQTKTALVASLEQANAKCVHDFCESTASIKDLQNQLSAVKQNESKAG
jgi:hypothetical protein